MKHRSDPALNITNPRLLSAVYFSLLAVVATIVINTVLYMLGIGQFIPIFAAVLLAVIVATIFAAIFGRRMIHCKKPYRLKVFFLGFFMVLAALPFYDLGFIYLLRSQESNGLSLNNLGQFFSIYLFVVFYSFMIAGLWLAILVGFAAIYLRAHVVYDILHIKDNNRQKPVSRKAAKPITLKTAHLPIHPIKK